MKFQILGFFFLLLCAQLLSTFALESKDEKGIVDFNASGKSGEDGLKRDELVFSKASKGKPSPGGQNDRTKKNKAGSMLIKPAAYISNIATVGLNSLELVFFPHHLYNKEDYTTIGITSRFKKNKSHNVERAETRETSEPGLIRQVLQPWENWRCSLQALSNLHYLFGGFMDYLWSRELDISNFGPADWSSPGQTFQETLTERNEGAFHLGPERPQVYYDLSPEEKIRYNADIRATNILLQGLPKDIYTLINHYNDAKNIWDNVKMLLEGFELTKEDRESQLFVTIVKLNRGLRDSKYDQLYAYLKQHE
nr:integrase, catalytic region, zinc finger, CCHC-type, peptidase aspartic, catalytic [Tanacetum cinerariifolium]